MEKKVIDWLDDKISAEPIGGGHIWSVDKTGGYQMIAEVRGWGAIQNLFKLKSGEIDFPKAEAFQDELAKYIASAIQEKVARDKHVGSSIVVCSTGK